MDFEIERKDVKHARIRVNELAEVRVIVPNNFTQDDITALLKHKEEWIKRSHKKLSSNRLSIELKDGQILLLGYRYKFCYSEDLGKEIIYDHIHKTIQTAIDLNVEANLHDFYLSFARTHLSSRLSFLSNKYKLFFNTFYLRSQSKKWGNCSKDKNISLNWKLIKTPEYVIDYVLLHELVHTVMMSHSTAFWFKLRSYMPTYKTSVEWLSKYGNSI
jgi:predicted metal-dependent hydrolase